jgi:hypothetical protein
MADEISEPKFITKKDFAIDDRGEMGAETLLHCCTQSS